MFIINCEHIGDTPCDHVEEGLASIAKQIVEIDLPEPTIFEIFELKDDMEVYIKQSDLLDYESKLFKAIAAAKEEAQESADYFAETKPNSYL